MCIRDSLGRHRGRPEVADEVSTLAFLGADGPGAAAAARNAAAVAAALEAIGEGPPLVVGPREALAKFGDPFARRGGHGDAPLLWRRRVTSWLAECEERHRFVVLECFDRGGGAAPKQFLRHWSRLALGNADKVVVVAHGARSRALAPRSLERRALYDRGPARSVVVLLAHEAGGPNPKRSGRWLAQRPSSARGPRLVHVVVGDDSDLARAARILAGRAVGVVLGGGGGRGLGHLGVLRALEAGGLPGSIGTVGSRRSVLSVGAAATFGALWKGDRAFAAASDGNHIGEPVVSGGPLPLTVGLSTGPPYVQKDVELAIDAGYRLFDTAQEYGSEEAIGNALKKAFRSGLKREDVFVTTKVDIYNMGYEATIRSVRESFDLLGRLDGGIDLVLIHWPCPFVSKDVPGAVQKYSSLRKSTWEAVSYTHLTLPTKA